MSEWWRGAAIYQIYPRSFLDTDGDGVGDLAGIARRLGHVARLGVDGVWIAPFYRSPMKDFGYDVSDLCDVDPLFGTLADADAVIAEAHRLGLKVVIDMVLSHSSDAHPWFLESRQSQDNPKADWYVWAEAREDGTPPNNWLSVFGGSAWSWEPRRQQYYLHNFLAAQPDLNIHCPAVQEALLEACRFWLARGVDGFRLDAVNFLAHDLELRSNPPRPKGHQPTEGVKATNPYNRQLHIYDKSRPEALAFLHRLRRLADGYGDVMLLGEIVDDSSLARIADYAGPGGPLHTAYSFALLRPELDLCVLRASLEAFRGEGKAWPAWAFSNHDVPRAASRWGDASPAFAKALLLLLATLRGTVFLYQGEELGLPEAEVPFERLRDPYGLAFWPDFAGRDGCRTPMPWTDGLHGGFSAAEPWLPVPEAHLARSVARAAADPGSVLHFARALFTWRRARPALRQGDIRFLELRERSLSYVRGAGPDGLFIAINLGGEPAELPAPEALGPTITELPLTAERRPGAVRLPPCGALVAHLSGGGQ